MKNIESKASTITSSKTGLETKKKSSVKVKKIL